MGIFSLLEHFLYLLRINLASAYLQPHAIIIHVVEIPVFSCNTCFRVQDSWRNAIDRLPENYVEVYFLVKSLFQCSERSCSFLFWAGGEEGNEV